MNPAVRARAAAARTPVGASMRKRGPAWRRRGAARTEDEGRARASAAAPSRVCARSARRAGLGPVPGGQDAALPLARSRTSTPIPSSCGGGLLPRPDSPGRRWNRGGIPSRVLTGAASQSVRGEVLQPRPSGPVAGHRTRHVDRTRLASRPTPARKSCSCGAVTRRAILDVCRCRWLLCSSMRGSAAQRHELKERGGLSHC
jgi:hypothetical protein